MCITDRNPYLKVLSVVSTLMIAMALGLSTLNLAYAEDHGSDHGGGHGSAGRGHAGGGHSGGDHGRGRQGNYDPGRERGHGGGAKAVENTVLKSGGRPVWAQEGLPEVELGRLNAARAPAHVLQKALGKAHEELESNPTGEIHAPLQNIALYKEAVTQGDLSKAARYLGFAAEKRMPINAEMVEALNIILGVSVPDNQAMADMADQVRQGILEAHDAGEIEDHH
ncbi:hypothetical protein Q9L42_018605 [Methylomarinum sp. Ch1-1]|uniref:Uncharacterized protein n=1 Tax=Methylomarinum roseum TaxID=3067653 RepID=A0AAU7NTP5_9GAMM|nr:hypothetical protein [Methylomarinum sp. Ch1-1]MDP4519612.1 hypothetical protein [Methylomarinum sp. Ch1-1]